MIDDYSAIIDESVKLEMLISDLYTLFHKLFPEDEGFWWQLLHEEVNHAALIQSIEDISDHLGDFPDSIFSSSLNDIKEANSKISSIINEFQSRNPTRKEAFNVALELEEDAGELHFQEFMDGSGSIYINKVFRQLNAGDKDHARRIRSYMLSNGIEVNPRAAKKSS